MIVWMSICLLSPAVMPDRKKVLVISPHPDDAELGCGGTIAKHAANGDHVTVMVLCTNSFANLPGEKTGTCQTTEKSMVSLHRSMEVLSFDRLICYDLEDETLDKCILTILQKIEPDYYDLKPDIVYCVHYGDNNQDHRATFEAAQVICRSQSMHSPSVFLCYEVPSSTEQSPNITGNAFLPNYFNIISQSLLDLKIKSFECYESEIRKKPHSRSRYGIELFARYRGLQCNSEYAEAFQQISAIHS